MTRVAVVGGGAAGLAAAWSLAAAGNAVTVLESEPQIGGRVKTLRYGPAQVDVGASFFAEFYTETLRLLHEIGLAGELEKFSLAAGIFRSGIFRPISPLSKLVTGGLLSPARLLRLGMGGLSLIPRWRSLTPNDLLAADRYDTETVESWSRRVLGREATDYLIEPVLRGVVHWDAHSTSCAVLFAMLKAALLYRGAYHLRGGLDSFCAALAESVKVEVGATVRRIAGDDSRWVVEYAKDGEVLSLDADAVVCGVPAVRVGGIVDLPEDAQRFFEDISYSSTAIGVIELGSADSVMPPSIFLSPREEPTISGITPNQPATGEPIAAPILRVSLSAEAYRAKSHLSDDELGAFILSAARRLPGVRELLAGATVRAVVRWPCALPIFDVGHLRRLRAWRARTPDFTTLAFAGDYLRGPYVEGAVKSGLEAAAALAGTFSRR